MKINKAIFIFFLILFPVLSNASSGMCDLTLYRIWFEKIDKNEFIRQEKIKDIKFEVKIPKDADPIDSYYLNGEIGPFKISAMFESGEASISNLSIWDASHSVNTFGDRLISMTDLKNMKSVSVYCKYVN